MEGFSREAQRPRIAMPIDTSNPPIPFYPMRIDVMHSQRVPSESAPAKNRVFSNQPFRIIHLGQFRDFQPPNLTTVPWRIVLCESKKSAITLKRASARPGQMWIAIDYRALGMLDPWSFESIRTEEAQAVVVFGDRSGEEPPCILIAKKGRIAIRLAHQQVGSKFPSNRKLNGAIEPNRHHFGGFRHHIDLIVESEDVGVRKVKGFLKHEAFVGPIQSIIAFGVCDFSKAGFLVEHFEEHVPS